MSKNLLKTVIILIAVTFVTLQSCEKKGIVNNDAKDENTFGIPIYEYSNNMKVSNKNGTSADITVFSDNKSALEYQVELIPIYEKPNTENVNFAENLSEEEFNEKPPVHFDIENVKLPKGAIGFKIIPLSSDKGWTTIYGYSSSYDAGFITKTNSSGKTKYKMGVLYTSSQWFYSKICSGTLKSKNSAANGAPGDFYKMYIKYKNKKSSTCNAYFYSY